MMSGSTSQLLSQYVILCIFIASFGLEAHDVLLSALEV